MAPLQLAFIVICLVCLVLLWGVVRLLRWARYARDLVRLHRQRADETAHLLNQERAANFLLHAALRAAPRTTNHEVN